MIQTLRAATYNIHKGFSFFKRRMVIHELREKLRALNADLVFLQEVLGSHDRHAARHDDWPREPQYEFLAHAVWNDFAYGRNAVYDAGHHGNAILSRFPMLETRQLHHDLVRAPLYGAATATPYGASKWAVRGISQCWQAELRPHGIRVTCVCPSEVQTNFGGKGGRNNPNKLYAEDIGETILAALNMPRRALWPELAVFANNPWKED